MVIIILRLKYTCSLQIRKVLSQPKSLQPEHQNDHCFNDLFVFLVFVLFPLTMVSKLKHNILRNFIQTQDSRLI